MWHHVVKIGSRQHYPFGRYDDSRAEHFYSYKGQFPRKLRFAIYIKRYKIYLCLNHYNFRTVKGINFLFSTLNTTSFLYGKIHLGVLHLLRASIASFDTPPGSNPP